MKDEENCEIAARADILRRLYELAFGRVNDAVKLAFLDPETGDWAVDTMDLSMVSDVKRLANGTVEVKLLDRVEAIRLLLGELSAGEKSDGSDLDSLITAIGDAARRDAAGTVKADEDRENI